MDANRTAPGLSLRKSGREPLAGGNVVDKRRFVPALLAVFVILGLLLPSTLPANAAPSLTIIPITWNIVGLNADNINTGPNTYLVGAQVCNTGDAPAVNVAAALFWENINTYIQNTGPETITLASLAAGACYDFYFPITVSRENGAIGTARRYHITAQANGIDPITTPSPREIYVEEFASSDNLATITINGPTNVYVGNTYTYIVESTTGANEYQQLVHSLAFPPNLVRLLSATTQYTNPTRTNDRIYADACGWIEDPASPNYRNCGPVPVFPGGVVSGSFVTIYQVQILAVGTAALNPVLFGFAEDSYSYASDFGQAGLTITASIEPTPTPSPTPVTPSPTPITPSPTSSPTNPPHQHFLPEVLRQGGANPTVTPTATLTPTPTFTGTINPTLGATKIVPTQVAMREDFTFTIRVINHGLHPATSINFTDNLSSAYPYLEITGASTDKGTVTNRTARSVTVTIPSLAPNEVAVITINGRVSATVTGTPQACNQASVTYQGGAITTPVTRSSNNACFRVLGGAVLPGTGEINISTSGSGAAGPDWILIGLSFVLGGMSIFGLWASLQAAGRQNRKAAPVFGLAVLFGCAAVIIYLFGIGMFETATEHQTNPDLVAEVEFVTSTSAPTQAASATLNPLAVAPAYLFSTPEPGPVKTLPAFPIPSPTIQVTPGPGEALPDTSPIKRMSIPSLGLFDAQVAYVPFDGQTWLIEGLREEIAWMGDTSWPGLGGNTALAGHLTVRGLGNGPFRYLGDLVAGDTVTLITESNIYTYSVINKKVVPETDLSILNQTDESRLTLITCINWHEEWEAYLDRMVVVADLVKVESIAVTAK